ncbi:unnamed protein product [Urochloa decumbens]|uniref:MATH domain-containing protein n=1 Tax=Urochloa decumbens TaxID=240449 RepID=A0ABC8VXH5_9POAL
MASSTATALMTAAARRLTSRPTASSMVLREVSGSHKLTIDGCRPSRKLRKGGWWWWSSKPFTVGGYSWRIRYYPHGQGHVDNDGRHVALYLELNPTDDAINEANCDVEFKLTLLNQSGRPVPEFSRGTVRPFIQQSRCHGFRDFVTWKDLEELGCLKDDRFSVRCDITVTADVADLGGAGAGAYDDDGGAAAPASAGDVARARVAMRSPGLQAELLAAASNSKKSNAAADRRRRIQIKDMEPKVFEAVLQHMYTNALPEKMDDGEDAMAMVQGLLAAADRFKVDGLKLACEETLSRRIDVSTAAGIQAVAEQHGCGALKAACVEFLMARPENLKAVVETEGYVKAKATIHPLVMDLAFKQYVAGLKMSVNSQVQMLLIKYLHQHNEPHVFLP